MTDTPFSFVLSELFGTSHNSTNETESALYSLLKAVSQDDEHELDDPVSASAAYAYVDSVLSGLDIAPYTLQKYRTIANQKVQFHSRGY